MTEAQYERLRRQIAAEERKKKEIVETLSCCDGRWRETEDRVSLSYKEPEDSGMGDSDTQLSFQKSEPGTLTLLRSGEVRAALVFEQGVRHHCNYVTPFMPFEVCIYARRVENQLLTDGELYISYIVEIRGAEAECCRLTISVRQDD